MTPLENESSESVGARDCASVLMDVVPLVMRAVRSEIRSHRSGELSVQQFRTLAYISRHYDASVSGVAEHLGLTLPSTSKTIECLVKRGLIQRAAFPGDRRRSILQLTHAGSSTLKSCQRATRDRMARMLIELPQDEMKLVCQAMKLLKPLFACNLESSIQPQECDDDNT